MRARFLVLLALTGCEKPLTCSCELADGRTMQRATVLAQSGESEVEARRRVLRQACEKLCAAGHDATPACPARCSVDAEAGKIGAHVTCGRK